MTSYLIYAFSVLILHKPVVANFHSFSTYMYAQIQIPDPTHPEHTNYDVTMQQCIGIRKALDPCGVYVLNESPLEHPHPPQSMAEGVGRNLGQSLSLFFAGFAGTRGQTSIFGRFSGQNE